MLIPHGCNTGLLTTCLCHPPGKNIVYKSLSSSAFLPSTMTPNQAGSPVREIDVLSAQLLRHGLSVSDLTRDGPATVSYRELSITCDRGSSTLGKITRAPATYFI